MPVLIRVTDRSFEGILICTIENAETRLAACLDLDARLMDYRGYIARLSYSSINRRFCQEKKANTMLLELAIGDAYGAGFEYATEMIEPCNNLAAYIQNPRHKAIKPGMYTDDTQMSLAIAEATLHDREWTAMKLACRFVQGFHRDPRAGYARGFYQFLKATTSGEQFLRVIRPTSDKSGAAMRAGCIGYCTDLQEVLDKAKMQAQLTHDTPDGIASAQAAALMTHYFIYNLGPKAELGVFICRHVQGDWNSDWRGTVKSKGWMSVRAAVTAVKRNDSLAMLLWDCVDFTGYVDAVATIAMAAVSCSKECDLDMPHVLIDELKNGRFGQGCLVKLDHELKEKFGKKMMNEQEN